MILFNDRQDAKCQQGSNNSVTALFFFCCSDEERRGATMAGFIKADGMKKVAVDRRHRSIDRSIEPSREEGQGAERSVSHRQSPSPLFEARRRSFWPRGLERTFYRSALAAPASLLLFSGGRG
jgi:hypothetical protein